MTKKESPTKGQEHVKMMGLSLQIYRSTYIHLKQTMPFSILGAVPS